jgi:hypothetical protein
MSKWTISDFSVSLGYVGDPVDLDAPEREGEREREREREREGERKAEGETGEK